MTPLLNKKSPYFPYDNVIDWYDNVNPYGRIRKVMQDNYLHNWKKKVEDNIKNIMRTRKSIEVDIQDRKIQVEKLNAEILELRKEDLMFSDQERQYVESIETHGRGKKKEEVLVGRVHWKETFVDEDTKQSLVINRSEPVKWNGEWL